jgi:thioredoxin reductase (NADPH)
MNARSHDCLIIGAGPAGLVAATYLGRYRRRTLVIDAGASRAELIPVSHNCPGFPDGISGIDLLARMRDQARRYGAQFLRATAQRIRRRADGCFETEHGSGVSVSRTVLLATGVVDVEPALPQVVDAVRQGLVRHCPVCDGFEAIDQNIAVIGHGEKLVREAVFLRDYSARVTVFSQSRELALAAPERNKLRRAGIAIVERPIVHVDIENKRIVALRDDSGACHRFDTLYSALGVVVRSDLARALGARHDSQGDLIVDRKRMQTSVPGMFAAGDVVEGLSQISVGSGQAAIAATAIHHALGRSLAHNGLGPHSSMKGEPHANPT